MTSFLFLKNRSGIATIALVMMGLVFIAVLFGAVNLAAERFSERQARMKEGLAAMVVMKDLAGMARRAFDLSQALGGVCPAWTNTVDLNPDGGGNSIRYCFPRRADSCVRHPFDPAPSDAAPTLPRICFDPATPGRIMPVTITHWTPSSVTPDEGLFSSDRAFVFRPLFLLFARGQALPKPWYPDMAGAPVYANAPSAAALPNYVHNCGPNRPCFTIRLCLRGWGNRVCPENDVVRQSFMLD